MSIQKASVLPLNNKQDKVKTLMQAYRVDPLKLAKLNFELFISLCGLGTPKIKICKTLQISEREYAYLRRLAEI